MIFSIIAVGMLILVCCNRNRHTVTVAGDYPLLNELEQNYPTGKKVTIELPTITEHYYLVYVNGEACVRDEKSDMEYSYFTFVMPDNDVVIEIEDHSVSIPRSS